MSATYNEAVPGKLKLKKKKKTGKPIRENAKEAEIAVEAKPTATMTKAEAAFERRQAILRAERIKKKAQSSHREKVEKLNEHLDSLTELNDIPKVSWTK
ncbi:protein FAM32a [Trichuris trichiura]|uniref:Protein FAM32a n=1 Tax=Trichuris trichiura TaxID=36087 RepID=A0A077ZJ35_TRITR|nr:protein FAM32a [Trichuris trichiura]